MTLSVAEIGKQALDGVANALTGVVHSAVLTTDEKGEYNRKTGGYDDTPNLTYTCRVLVRNTPTGLTLGTHIITAKEQVLLLEGLKVVPAENHRLVFKGKTKTIVFVEDVLDAGGMYNVVVK